MSRDATVQTVSAAQERCCHDETVPVEYPTDRVERELRQLIATMRPGDRLPSVGDLAAEHHTSRATVSKAVQRLVDAGLLVVLPNYGTFVAE